jgi:hypothetical protein
MTPDQELETLALDDLHDVIKRVRSFDASLMSELLKIDRMLKNNPEFVEDARVGGILVRLEESQTARDILLAELSKDFERSQ